MIRRQNSRPFARSPGFTLIELMISMVLGLIVIAGVISVFLAGQQSYRTNLALGQVQDSGRISFELMTRQIRTTGLNGCDNSGRVANILNNGPSNGGTTWWANWNAPLVGYDASLADPAVTFGTGTGQRVAGTDSIALIGAMDSGFSIKLNSEPAGTVKLNDTGVPLQAGSIVIMCDPDHATLLQVNSWSSGSSTFTHNMGGTPGNCTGAIGYPAACAPLGNSYQFSPNAQVSRVAADDWYIGYNAIGGKSLYRMDLAISAGGVPTPTPQEMVRNVTAMSITYLVSGASSFVSASSVTNWGSVTGVRVAMVMQSTDANAGTNNQPITRNLVTTTTLRNRVK